MNPTIAKVQAFFSLHTLSMFLDVSSIATFVVAINWIARHSPFQTPYLSRIFFLCWLPFALCAASAFAGLVRLGYDWKPYYPSLWANHFMHLTIFGAVLSAIAIAYYSLKRLPPRSEN